MAWSLSLADIAAATGLHRTSISRILRGAQPMHCSPETLVRVFSAAAELGWQPACHPDTRRCVLVVGRGHIAHAASSLAGLNQHLARRLKQAGLDMRLIQSFGDESWRIRLRPPPPLAAGIILHHESAGAPLPPGPWQQAPMVALNWPVLSPGIDAVVPDDAGGAAALGSLLLARRRMRVLYLLPSEQRHLASERNRWLGLCRVLMPAGGEVHRVRLGPDENSLPDLIRSHGRVEALVAYNTMQVKGIMAALDHMKLRVPQDIGLACCDDQTELQHLSPPITAVHVPFKLMVDAAVDLLLDPRPPGMPPRRLVVDEWVCDRGSLDRDPA